MTKKNMRNELDLSLSSCIRSGDYFAFSTLLDFAFFTDLISGTEYKWLLRTFRQGASI